MLLGLKSGTLELIDHHSEWEVIAIESIKKLWNILGSTAKDMQHIGSTSIKHIKAKPVIDIAVAVSNFDNVLALSPILAKNGFIFRGWEGENDKQPVFQCGEYIPEENDMRTMTHYIHIVKADSQQWHNYINFRDYMNAFPEAAFEYEKLKIRCADENKHDGNLHNYHKGKQSYITKIIQTANLWNDSGRP